MKLGFNDFLRIMSAVLIVLLVFQGLDYVTGFGVNNYLFVIFCIAFAFTMGSIYYNILLEKKREMENEQTDRIHEVLISIRDDGLTDDVIDELEDVLLNLSNSNHGD